MEKCNHKTEVYSRIVGYYRPVQQWNKGKQEEYKDRKVFKTDDFTNENSFLCKDFEVEGELAAAI